MISPSQLQNAKDLNKINICLNKIIKNVKYYQKLGKNKLINQSKNKIKYLYILIHLNIQTFYIVSVRLILFIYQILNKKNINI